MAAAHSPASSPRLPSPPPIAEDQVGPTSPGISLYEDHGKLQTPIDSNAAASRRIRPGTKAEDMAEGPPLVDLQDLDSPFQLTEHLKALHYSYTHPADSSAVQPITASIAHDLAQPPPHTASEIWLYELGRFLIQKTNQIIVALFADTPACSAQTCPEMRASEWQYLCAVHDPPKSCSAIDYCCHTLDWAATTLTSSKMFPSRLGLGSSPSSSLSAAGTAAALTTDKVLASQMKEITNIFRRVYRIYAHAWFQHREMFWRVEGKTGLYVLFKTVCDEYGLIQPENYTIPPEAEGQEPREKEESGAGSRTQQQQQQLQTPMLLKRDMGAEGFGNDAGVDTTKRHRHTLSDRSSSVTTVIQEEVEEEDEHPTTTTTTMTTTEGPEEQDEKSLERQATSLKDFAESLPQPQQPHRDEAEVKEEEQPTKPEDSAPVNTEDPTATQPPTVKEEEIPEDVDEAPVPGIERSETIKPSKEGEGEEGEGENPAETKAEEQQVEQGESSEISAPAVAAVAEAEEKPELDQKLAPMEPSEAKAAEGAEAGKTVAD
ncbi:hypothetical protein D0860_05158 [Hortaea werneckii]|uniref:Mob1/phocein n=1 Tax=Hortaea werneckii TaxID=91943 RepID=A0A3M7H2W7_HORWE|nr:hypothetical protein D0860_05158 [Hortaea werneckii]